MASFDLNESYGGQLSDNDEYTYELNLNLDAPFVDDNVEGKIIDKEDEGGDGEVEGEGEGDVDDMDNKIFIVNVLSVGMKFNSIEEALQYYQLYDKQLSFGVCKRSSHKNGEDIYHYSFACLKHKKYVIKDCDKSSIPERRRAVVRTECKASITIGYNDFIGTWVVCTINLEHNHDLNPDSSFLIPSYRYIPIRFQKILEYNEDLGMAPKNNIDVVIKSAGGYGKCTFMRRDARNYLDKYIRRKLRAVGGDDAVLLVDYFEKKNWRIEISSFLTNLQMRAVYGIFFGLMGMVGQRTNIFMMC
jgi:FAR1 DNA-binding domain